MQVNRVSKASVQFRLSLIASKSKVMKICRKPNYENEIILLQKIKRELKISRNLFILVL